jgi:CRP-like cAMP-binding protein
VIQVDSSAFVAGSELVEALRSQSVPVQCPRDRVLFQQGDDPSGVYILHGGNATLTMTSISGEELMHIESGPGSLLGLPGIIGNKPYSLTAVASRGARVSFVPREEFTALMAREPALSLMVLKILAAEVHTAREAIFAA